MSLNFKIIGSDKRLEYLKFSLIDDGHKICENICENIILPIPVTRNNNFILGTNVDLNNFFLNLPDNCTVFCGCKYLLDKNIIKNRKIFDYSDNEMFLLENAKLTAYGALKIILEKVNKPFDDIKILISGFGRIGKILSNFLVKLNMKVYVFGHSDEDIFWAENIGARYLHNLKNLDFDFIVNTAPNMIFSNKVIENIKSDPIFIELASKPGIDKKECQNRNFEYISALGIPGKLFPKYSSQIIKESIYKIIKSKLQYINGVKNG